MIQFKASPPHTPHFTLPPWLSPPLSSPSPSSSPFLPPSPPFLSLLNFITTHKHTRSFLSIFPSHSFNLLFSFPLLPWHLPFTPSHKSHSIILHSALPFLPCYSSSPLHLTTLHPTRLLASHNPITSCNTISYLA